MATAFRVPKGPRQPGELFELEKARKAFYKRRAAAPKKNTKTKTMGTSRDGIAATILKRKKKAPKKAKKK